MIATKIKSKNTKNEVRCANEFLVYYLFGFGWSLPSVECCFCFCCCCRCVLLRIVIKSVSMSAKVANDHGDNDDDDDDYVNADLRISRIC